MNIVGFLYWALIKRHQSENHSVNHWIWDFCIRGILKTIVRALPKGQKAENKLPGWSMGQKWGSKVWSPLPLQGRTMPIFLHDLHQCLIPAVWTLPQLPAGYPWHIPMAFTPVFMLQWNASVVTEPKNGSAFMKLYGHTARIALFSYAAAQKHIHPGSLQWNKCFSYFLKVWKILKDFLIENH